MILILSNPYYLLVVKFIDITSQYNKDNKLLKNINLLHANLLSQLREQYIVSAWQHHLSHRAFLLLTVNPSQGFLNFYSINKKKTLRILSMKLKFFVSCRAATELLGLFLSREIDMSRKLLIMLFVHNRTL